MMDIALDEVIHFDAVTSDSSGAAADADSTPTWAIFEEATDTPILAAQNFTKRTSLDGEYRGSATLSTANGFEAGKWYHVKGYATVDAVAGKAVVFGPFRVVPAESVAGVPKVDVSHAEGVAWAIAVTAPIRTGTAQAGGASTITLDVSASATNDWYNDRLIYLTGGTGVGQVAWITDYVGSTQVATVKPAWITEPDNTTTFAVPAPYAPGRAVAHGSPADPAALIPAPTEPVTT